ncbi:MAG: class I SAM-dependent methyltransferase [Acidobacteria bacterium]|nr:class I SAM-dependent methyltransferase [Acidobacteriota bacterium]
MTESSEFWDALAPHHSSIEDNYLDLSSLRLILGDIHPPVLVVGAGQGLIVEALRNKGFHTDGVDFSPEMIRYGKTRRGLELIQADARDMPFQDGSYHTILYTTGVIDFLADEEQIRLMMSEAKRVVAPSGNIFVAFYRFSRATEDFLTRLGILKDNVLYVRESLRIHQLNPGQVIAWVAKKAEIGLFSAATLLLRSWFLSPRRENQLAMNMRKIFKQMDNPNSLINAVPESQPYRSEPQIRHLFNRLGIPMKRFEASASCYLVQI